MRDSGTSLVSTSPTPGNSVRSLPRQNSHKGTLLRSNYVVAQGSQNFPVKNQLINILGSVAYRYQPQLVNFVTVAGKQPQTTCNDRAGFSCHMTLPTRIGSKPNLVCLSSSLASLVVWKRQPDLRFNSRPTLYKICGFGHAPL